MRNQKLEIGEWRQTALTVTPTTGSRLRRRTFSTRVLELVGTFVLYSLVLQSVLLGSRAHKVRPAEDEGLGATLGKSQAIPSETLILVDLPNASMTEQPLFEEIASLGPADATTVELLSPDPLPHIDIPVESLVKEPDADAAIDSGDPAVRAAMFGRYTRQIDARIERLWRRPRSPVNSSAHPLRNLEEASASNNFKCQVRIIQDVLGRVHEVQLLSCNGTVKWQQSLVAAILAASPLPAPPNPTVFTKAVTMTFTASPYTQASAADDYEIESKTFVRVADRK